MKVREVVQMTHRDQIRNSARQRIGDRIGARIRQMGPSEREAVDLVLDELSDLIDEDREGHNESVIEAFRELLAGP